MHSGTWAKAFGTDSPRDQGTDEQQKQSSKVSEFSS